MLDARTENSLQVRMDLRQQPPQPVGDASCFAGQVVVEPDDHLQLGDGLVFEVDRAERVRHNAGRVRDDEGVTGVGLGLAVSPQMVLSGASRRGGTQG